MKLFTAFILAVVSLTACFTAPGLFATELTVAGLILGFMILSTLESISVGIYLLLGKQSSEMSQADKDYINGVTK